MGAFPPVDDVGPHQVELETDRHFDEHLELDDLRLVFRAKDVQLDQAFVGRFSDALSDAQVSILSVRRTNPADLHPCPV
jgi:hypothetical protein